jgi:quinoprotein glucose dehydrogenase
MRIRENSAMTRVDANLFANSVIALNARTGGCAWHFQTVRYDFWDYDIPWPADEYL